ncbi:hypothetical protein Tco_0796371 [Tanacetum coccineum]
MSSSSAPTDTQAISSTSGARGSPRQRSPSYYPLHQQPSSPDYTSATPHTNDESDYFETSKTRVTSPHSTTPPADPISPLSPQRPLLTQTASTYIPLQSFYYRSTTRMAVRTQPTLSPSYSAKLTEAMGQSPSSFCKRYRGTSKLIEDIEIEGTESKDEGTDSKDEETTPEGQQLAIPTEDTAKDEPLGLGYRAAGRCALERSKDTVPSTYEVGQSSRSTPDHQLETAGETPIQTHARLPIHTTWEDPEDGSIYMDIMCDISLVSSPVRASPALVKTPPSSVGTPASLEWSPESPSVSPVIPSPVASPAPTTVLGEDVLQEIGAQLKLHGSVLHTHCEHLDALPPSRFEGYDRDVIELFSRYEGRREIYNLQRQHAADQREMQELKDRIAALEQRMDRREE